jgi:hypothetical protein
LCDEYGKRKLQIFLQQIHKKALHDADNYIGFELFCPFVFIYKSLTNKIPG